MRHLTTAAALTTLLALAGCLGGGGSGHHPLPTVTVAGVGGAIVVSHAGVYDVLVSGTGNSVTIGLNQTIRNMLIEGTDSEAYVGSTSTISGAVTLDGTNAILHLPPGSAITVNITGLGGQVFYDAFGG